MNRCLVVLSGNVGVGKTTIGPYLADELVASWLSETAISSMFAHLFAKDDKLSRIISQMTFSTMRVATILSSFLSGETMVVSERNLRDSLIFHEIWRNRFTLQEHDSFFDKFYSMLSSHLIELPTVTVWLKCPLDILMKRISCRVAVFEQNHTKQMLMELEEKYTKSFENNPPQNLLIYDVARLANNAQSMKSFASRVASDVKDLIKG